MAENHVLYTYSIDKDQEMVESVDPDALIEQTKWSWIHLDAANEQTRIWLDQHIHYHDGLIVDALLAEETRPRMMRFDDGVLLILRGVNLNENSNPEDMVSIRLWVTERYVISVQLRELKTIRDMIESCRSANPPDNSGAFICSLISHLFRGISPTLTALDDLTDDIEEKILESVDVSYREEIVSIRKQAIVIRRYITPQRDAIQQLARIDQSWIGDNQKRQLYESLNDITRYIEDLDALRERAQIIKDELQNILADRLNKNMYILSVIAAIFLPLGFLTGLLGINLPGIPGADTANAFLFFVAFLLALVIGQIWLFKKLKWF